MKPYGFFVFGSMNWSGGNDRSTPSFAFLLLVHLSRIEPSAVVAAIAGAAPVTSAPAPAPRIAALSRSPRVVPAFGRAVSLSGISTSGGWGARLPATFAERAEFCNAHGFGAVGSSAGA